MAPARLGGGPSAGPAALHLAGGGQARTAGAPRVPPPAAGAGQAGQLRTFLKGPESTETSDLHFTLPAVMSPKELLANEMSYSARNI